MKILHFIFLAIFIIPFTGFTQIIDSIDYVSPFHEDFAAINKGDEWAIINKKGTITIPFREDLVEYNQDKGDYPTFNDGRCLVMKVEDNVTYFGFIDKTGKTVIEPKFINATPFKYNKAVVLLLVKQHLGYNNLLDKPVFTYKSQEVIIDDSGKIINYLTKLIPIQSLKPFEKIPKIKSKMISKDLVAIKSENDLTILKKI